MMNSQNSSRPVRTTCTHMAMVKSRENRPRPASCDIICPPRRRRPLSRPRRGGSIQAPRQFPGIRLLGRRQAHDLGLVALVLALDEEGQGVGGGVAERVDPRLLG